VSPQPEPVRLKRIVPLRKEEAFEICDALAAAETALARYGLESEARRLGAAFAVAEAALVQ